MTIAVLVYGTLRTGAPDADLTTVKGHLYSVHGSFPALILDENGEDIVCERRVIEAERLKAWDAYEGYSEEIPPSQCHYIRRQLDNGDYIYEYNRKVSNLPRVDGGDWLARGGRINARYS